MSLEWTGKGDGDPTCEEIEETRYWQDGSIELSDEFFLLLWGCRDDGLALLGEGVHFLFVRHVVVWVKEQGEGKET